ncbi:P2Y purinoceptor 1 [Salarias fasciatus]|uniref:P2Y purinoceptor 1 n=1 Tax=Salarias fasciatus TaxID=181472 RepID=UPI00117685F6|nr:P2Y purinoceptor 1-like [Salarias fasciatus]
MERESWNGPKEPTDIFKSQHISEIVSRCEELGLELGLESVWDGVDMLVFTAGLLANAALLGLFLREGNPLSASKVFGLNLVLMDFLFLSMMPFSLIFKKIQSIGRNHTDYPTSPVEKARNTFDVFNMIGCPLLLACMCVERSLAVMRPVLYLRARKWEYKVAACAVVWAVTFSFCIATGVLEDAASVVVSVSVIVSCLFVVMLACLGGIVWSLWRQSPAHSDSPLKRRAVGNVLAVAVPAVLSYLPVLVMLPAVLYIFYWTKVVNRSMCEVFEVSLFFPKFGVLIAPVFYLSKARQMCCSCSREK